MSILIGADFIPTKENEELFRKGDLVALIGNELKRVLESSDYRIFNLEAPLTENSLPIKKRGANLYGAKECVAAYESANVNLFTLANNHIMDYGEQGLNDTLELLKKSNINYVGVGKNLREAAKPFYFSVNGKKIGVFAAVQHEYSIATETNAGANLFDVFESFDQIAEMKLHCDYVIVLYHGGRECYRYPTPYMQKLCRKMVDKGANLVVCQHSHCIGCEEKYSGGTIVYGQEIFCLQGKKMNIGIPLCLFA